MDDSRKEYSKDIDRVFRLPRVWSNHELRKFAHFFEGDIVNVSGWRDQDKEGGIYKQYFTRQKTYTITNYKSEARGYQGFKNELFLDLTDELPEHLAGKFDLVFNHTVLEHIYEINKAFHNLCKMSRDAVIVVVPFLQEMHAVYGDYWRFTPLTMKRLFEDNNMHLQYCSFNSHVGASVYLFCIGLRNPESWENRIPYQFDYKDPFPSENKFENLVGCHAFSKPKSVWRTTLRTLFMHK